MYGLVSIVLLLTTTCGSKCDFETHGVCVFVDKHGPDKAEVSRALTHWIVWMAVVTGKKEKKLRKQVGWLQTISYSSHKPGLRTTGMYEPRLARIWVYSQYSPAMRRRVLAHELIHHYFYVNALYPYGDYHHVDPIWQRLISDWPLTENIYAR